MLTRYPLRYVLPLLAFLLALVMQGVVIGLNYRHDLQLLRRVGEANLRAEMTFVQGVVLDDVSNDRLLTLKRKLQNLAMNSYDYMAILDTSGRVTLSGRSGDEGRVVQELRPGYQASLAIQASRERLGLLDVESDPTKMFAYFPLRTDWVAVDPENKHEVGVLYAEYDLSLQLNELQQKLRWVSLQNFGLILIAVMSFAALIHIVFSRRAAKLLQSIASARSTQESGPIEPLRGGDEIAILSRNFVELMAELDARNTRLQESEHQERRARLVAEHASMAKSEFLAMVSHELRTPLNPVVGLSDLMLDCYDLDTETRNGVQTINASGKHLLRLIEGILDFSRLELGRTPLESSPIPLREVLEDAVDLYRCEAQAKGLSLQADLNLPENLAVIADPASLKKVVENVLNNAVKFSSEGEVLLSARFSFQAPARGQFRLRIQDQGPGIPPEKLDTIFSMFEQGDNSITRRYGGLGMGLAICKRIVELYSGTVRAENHPEGGSIFHVEMCLDVAEHSAVPTRQVEGPTFRNIHALLVEDDLGNQMVTRKVLDHLEITHDSAWNGKEALELLNTKGYDLILLDIHLPDISGLTVLTQLRKESSTPVFVFTADSRDSIKAKSLELGANGFILKPIGYEQFVESLQSVLGS